MKHLEKIQYLLPLGYLYLVALGVLKEATFLYQLNINILNYSSIMDVLISPIATMTSHPLVFAVIISIFLICYTIPGILYKYDDRPSVQKMFDLKKTKKDYPETEIREYYLFKAAGFCAVFLLSIYLGYGFAEGNMTAKKMKEGSLKYKYRLTYTDGESKIISLVETNSLYYFYVAQGDKSVTIAPVSGIKNIMLLPDIR